MVTTFCQRILIMISDETSRLQVGHFATHHLPYSLPPLFVHLKPLAPLPYLTILLVFESKQMDRKCIRKVGLPLEPATPSQLPRHPPPLLLTLNYSHSLAILLRYFSLSRHPLQLLLTPSPPPHPPPLPLTPSPPSLALHYYG